MYVVWVILYKAVSHLLSSRMALDLATIYNSIRRKMLTTFTTPSGSFV